MQKDKLTLKEDVTSDFLTQLFSNFDKVYGKGKKIEIELRTVGEPPVLNIESGSQIQTLDANLEIIAKNPFNPDYEAVILQADFKAAVDFELRLVGDEYNLIMDLKKEATTLTVSDLQLLFYSELSLDQLNDPERMKPLTDLLVASIDWTLEDR